MGEYFAERAVSKWSRKEGEEEGGRERRVEMFVRPGEVVWVVQ